MGVFEEIDMPDQGVRSRHFVSCATHQRLNIDQAGVCHGDSDRVILKDKWMRERAALGIFRGIRDFIEASPGQM